MYLYWELGGRRGKRNPTRPALGWAERVKAGARAGMAPGLHAGWRLKPEFPPLPAAALPGVPSHLPAQLTRPPPLIQTSHAPLPAESAGLPTHVGSVSQQHWHCNGAGGAQTVRSHLVEGRPAQSHSTQQRLWLRAAAGLPAHGLGPTAWLHRRQEREHAENHCRQCGALGAF